MMNIAKDARLTDSLERELMAQAIAEQQSYNIIADLKALFAKIRANTRSVNTAKPAHSTVTQTA
ncbi:hypothetical protein H0A58_04005 [Alcaligenaceae bacterium]|nr:hypothetical protein [Alcaligenaceae bacterium]